MKRNLIFFLIITAVHFVLNVAIFGVLFSRGMNQVPRTAFDDILVAVETILSFPLSLFSLQTFLPLSLLNSALWGGIVTVLIFLGSRAKRYEPGNAYLSDCLLQLTKLKKNADRAIAQVADEQFFALPDPESNSIALIMKHLAGNMRSRWTDFLTSDGEKPNRNRDTEFEQTTNDTRESVVSAWENGWRLTLSTISALNPGDLGRTVLIRGEPHTVLQAINRQLAHYASHVGQIIFLAKHYAGPRWQTLSIPRGKSKDFEVSKNGNQYKPSSS